MARKSTTKASRRIIAGGDSVQEADIILSAPELFYFDINKYIRSIKAASSINFSYRTQL